MELADPQRSYAVLIGSSRYDDPALEDLPAVANNVARLAELLEDPTVWGLPPGHCVRVPEPRSPAEALDAIHDAARRAQDTLLVYYAGHGLTHHADLDGLLLALPTTDPERPYTAVGFDDVRREVLSVDRHVNRVVILDSCYSGRALSGGMGGPVEFAEQTRIAGSYLLTACAATRLAQAPPGETYTTFTGELIRLLEGGLAGEDTVIGVSRIYDHLQAELRARGGPAPQQRLSNTGRTLAFARNRYVRYVAAPVEMGERPAGEGARELSVERGARLRTLRIPEPAPPVVPEKWRALLREKPRVIVAEAVRLRNAGARHIVPSRELLRLAAVLRPAQEVATLVSLLRPALADAQNAVLQVVAARGPQVVADCVEALDAMDSDPRDVEDLLSQVAVRFDAEGLVATVRALMAAGRPEAELLLRMALAAARTTGQIIALLGALWSAELDGEADDLLRAVTTESAEEAARLADALLGIGREETAFELYAQVAHVVVRRRAAELTRVLGAMDTAGHGERADLLLRAAVEAATTPRGVGDLCEALWSAGMDSRALDALDRAAATLSPDDVVTLADALRTEGREHAILDLLRAAALVSPVAVTVRFVDALREMGRPVDANRMLAGAAERPAGEIAVLLARFAQDDRGRDRLRLETAVGRRPAAVRAAVAFGQALVRAGEPDDLVTTLAGAAQDGFPEVLGSLRRVGDHRHLLLFLTHLVRTDPRSAAGLLARLDTWFRPEAAVLRALLHDHDRDRDHDRDNDNDRAPDRGTGRGAAGSVFPSDAEIHALVSGEPAALDVESRAYGVAALCALRDVQVMRVFEGSGAFLSVGAVVEWLTALRRRGLDGCARALIRSNRRRDAGSLAALVPAIHRAGHAEYAQYALERSAFVLGSERVTSLSRSLTPEPPAPEKPPPR